MQATEYIKTLKINFNLIKVVAPSVVIVLISSLFFLSDHYFQGLSGFAHVISFVTSLILTISIYSDISREVSQGTWSHLMTSKIRAIHIVFSKIFCLHPMSWFWYIVSGLVISYNLELGLDLSRFARVIISQLFISSMILVYSLWINSDWGRLTGKTSFAFFKIILSLGGFLVLSSLAAIYSSDFRLLPKDIRRIARVLDFQDFSVLSESLLLYVFPILIVLTLLLSAIRMIKSQKGESLFPIVMTFLVPLLVSYIAYFWLVISLGIREEVSSLMIIITSFYAVSFVLFSFDLLLNPPKILNYRRFFQGLNSMGSGGVFHKIPQHFISAMYYIASLVALLVYGLIVKESIKIDTIWVVCSLSFLFFRDTIVYFIFKLNFKRSYIVLYSCYLLIAWFILPLMVYLITREERHLIAFFPPLAHIESNLFKYDEYVKLLPYIECVVVSIVLVFSMYMHKIMERVWKS